MEDRRARHAANHWVTKNWTQFTNWKAICCSVAQSDLILCDLMDCSMPGFPVLHHLLEFAQIHVQALDLRLQKRKGHLFMGWGNCRAGLLCWADVWEVGGAGLPYGENWAKILIVSLKSCCSIAQSYPTFRNRMAAACQASLSFSTSQSLHNLKSIELVMSPNHLVLCHPLLLLPSIFPNIRVFSNNSALHNKWAN